jgi:tetratricopeptide (TPR) repeat protein
MYNKVLAKEPGYVISLNNKGVTLANLGYHKQALKWYDHALEKVPDDLDMIANKARLLGLELDKYTDALKLLNHNLKKNPDHKGLLCNKAEILEKMGNKNTAIPIKDKLIKLYSDNYKCGFFKKTNIDDIVGESFI